MKLILIPVSYLFRVIVAFRNFFYNKGIFKIKKLSTAVISIGNIAAGGTGKTPFVELIADYILNKGIFTAIVSKGYKREYDDIKVVEVGFANDAHELNSENLGDEALMLLENLSANKSGRGLLVVGDDKSKTAKFAVAKFKPEVLIIDDGYQHRKLSRDLDIVIIVPGADKNMIPAGNLREPSKNINRADLVVVNSKFDKYAIAENTKNKSLVLCDYIFEKFININGDEMITKDVLNCIAFCGIAEPGSFKMLLNEINVKINDFITFPDHHNFSVKDIKRIIDSYSSTGSKYIITTQKDFVRIKNSELVLEAKSANIYKNLLFNYPLYYAKIKMQIKQNAKLLWNEIDSILELV